LTYGNIVLEIIRQVCTFKNNNQYLMIYEEDFYQRNDCGYDGGNAGFL